MERNHFEHKYKHNHDHGDKFEHFLGDKHKRNHFEHTYKNNHDHEHQQHFATMKNDAEDTVEALAEDQEFVADLEKICAENYDKAIPSAAALRVEEWARGRQVSRAWRSLCDNMVARLDTLHEAEATSYMQEIFG